MRGVTTQVSYPNSSTAWTMALKRKSDTCGDAPSLLKMRVILLQNSLARDKFFPIAVQLSSASKITHPRYLKEFTISRGIP